MKDLLHPVKAQHIATLDPSGHLPEGLASFELHGVPLTRRCVLLSSFPRLALPMTVGSRRQGQAMFFTL